MPRMALTDRFCARVQPGPSRVDYFDLTVPGLCLRVSPKGVRTWTYIYTSPRDGRRARLTLGRYPTVSLLQARGKAQQACQQANDKTDPRDALAAQATAEITVARLAELYLEMHVRPNMRTAANFEQRLKKNVIPVIGTVRIAELHARDVNRCTDAIIARGKPVEANRIFEAIRAMLRWAVKRGDLDRSPLEGKAKPGRESAPRDRVLTNAEITHLWGILPVALANSVDCQRIIRLALILGQRIGEIAGMRRDELDLDREVWTIPGSRVKNGSTQVVPLPRIAIEVIKDALHDAGPNCPFVFPSPTADKSGKAKPIAAHAVTTAVRRAHTPNKAQPRGRFNMAMWKIHDLRRTVLTGMAKLGVQPIVIGAIANHLSVTAGNVTFAHYVRHDYGR
ncbi:MAG: tyrosine-type recombinase/integrase, partial [Rhizomicrobium sp.]